MPEGRLTWDEAAAEARAALAALARGWKARGLGYTEAAQALQRSAADALDLGYPGQDDGDG